MSHAHAQPDSRDAFEVAIICALRIELDAVEAIFDQFYEEEVNYNKASGDENSYSLGRIGRHNVVLAYMPGIGKAASATVAASFRASFPSIRLGLVVGVCGGVPRDENTNAEILLGDVIISTGVIQFDFGRQLPDQVVRKDTLQDNLGRPNREIRGFLNKIQGWRGRTEMSYRIVENTAEICGKAGFKDWNHPGIQHDRLLPAIYRHKHQIPGECTTCDKCVDDKGHVCDDALSSDCTLLKCDIKKAVVRERIKELQANLESTEQSIMPPVLQFGLVASGDLVMKSATRRDELAAREKVIGFEMEGAGAWDTFPTVIIKGVCDYADSHKNKKWQKYAAVTAAACTKAFLRQWRCVEKTSAVTRDGPLQQQNGPSVNVRQGGSEFRGPTMVSGGMVFQGNYTGI
jgi:nucleoside phosphorylase